MAIVMVLLAIVLIFSVLIPTFSAVNDENRNTDYGYNYGYGYGYGYGQLCGSGYEAGELEGEEHG